jgi:hypothetical protein
MAWMRAYKYADNPMREQMSQQEIVNAVMNEICTWFEFNRS